jgi:predicted outer membrane repeat protein|tara:strand:+ start:6682 stop:8139 length:1458 start_codon:yes stop_codon:yes gene_type:complete
MDVIVDTFSMLNPTDYYAFPLDSMSFDIRYGLNEQISSNIYVSPTGDNSNDGLTSDTPLKNISNALSRIVSDSLNQRSVFLAEGVYSYSNNGENFPLNIPNYVNLFGAGINETILDGENIIKLTGIINKMDIGIQNLSLINGFGKYGGGIIVSNSKCYFQNAEIKSNYSIFLGGGMEISESQVSLKNCVFNSNYCNFLGGGFFTVDSEITLEKCQLIRNTAEDRGGGIYSSSSHLDIINSNIYENRTIILEGGGIYSKNSDMNFINSIFWDNNLYQMYFGNSQNVDTISIAYCDIEGGEDNIYISPIVNFNWLEGNIDEDPLFVDPANSDYTLQENSPCIDAGIAFYVWDGDTLVNMSPDEYVGSAPDMGAFEYGAVSINDDQEEIPQKFALYQNYPNPFNPVTTIRLDIPVETTDPVVSGRRSSGTSLQIFDVKGRLVETLIDDAMERGLHSVIWDASSVASGVYIYQLKSGGFIQTRKLVVLK